VIVFLDCCKRLLIGVSCWWSPLTANVHVWLAMMFVSWQRKRHHLIGGAEYLFLARTVRQKQTAHGLRRQLIWLVVLTRGAVGLWTWNATANATIWLQWCFRPYVMCCCDCWLFGRFRYAMSAVRSLVLTLCFMWLSSWIAVSGFLLECLVVDELWLLTYMYGWQCWLFHDNANGTNWLAALNTWCWCARCCKNKLHADCDDNCLIGGLNVWCGWFVNLECNCKCDNMIAMVLQCVRSVLLWLVCV